MSGEPTPKTHPHLFKQYAFAPLIDANGTVLGYSVDVGDEEAYAQALGFYWTTPAPAPQRWRSTSMRRRHTSRAWGVFRPQPSSAANARAALAQDAYWKQRVVDRNERTFDFRGSDCLKRCFN